LHGLASSLCSLVNSVVNAFAVERAEFTKTDFSAAASIA
jgi:hypothetical protein